MPTHSKFYSANEGDALKWLVNNVSFASDDKPLASSMTQAELDEGSLYRAGARGQSLPDPLFVKSKTHNETSTQSKFHLTREVEHEAKEETSHEDTPGSNGAVNLEADLQALAVTDIGDHFKQWAHKKREGLEAIPFVVAKAPESTHMKSANKAYAGSPPPKVTISSDAGCEETSDSVQGTLKRSVSYSDSDGAINSDDALDDGDSVASNEKPPGDRIPPWKKDGMTKRAAQIAKVKAASNKAVLTKPTASEKRSALRKNKNYKSIYEPKPENEPEQSEKKLPVSTTIITHCNNENVHNAVQLAIQRGLINHSDDNMVQALMEVIAEAGKQKSDQEADNGDNGDKKGEGGIDGDGEKEKLKAKSQRLKGKARKEAKEAAQKSAE